MNRHPHHQSTLEPEARRAAIEAVEAIARDLWDLQRLDPGEAAEGSRVAAQAAELSLGWGWPGLAIFFAQVAASDATSLPEADLVEQACHCLNRAIEGTASVRTPPSLLFGYVGLGWTLSHLCGRIIDTETVDASCAAIDGALLDDLERLPPGLRVADVIQGILGVAVYALERWPHAAAQEIFDRLLTRLEETAHKDGGHTWWRLETPQLAAEERRRFPSGYASAGLAHGVSGVIAVLAMARLRGLEDRRLEALLLPAVEWLLAQRHERAKVSSFPTYILPDGTCTFQRAAWCHGDPGIAVALNLAAAASHRSDWRHLAVETMLASSRRSPELTGNLDAGLCHGAAGMAHLLLRLAQHTGDSRLAEEAAQWVARSLAQRRPDQGIGGFLSRPPDVHGRPRQHATPGLLQGAAGIGLALLAAATGQEATWDRSLLLSSPRSLEGTP